MSFQIRVGIHPGGRGDSKLVVNLGNSPRKKVAQNVELSRSLGEQNPNSSRFDELK